MAAESFVPMSEAQFAQLSCGDIVRHATGETWVIMANYGGRMTAVRTMDIHNRTEWQLLFKSNYQAIPPEPS